MTDSIAVVAGVGPGLGASLVRQFASAGMTVVAAARNATQLTELKDELGDQVHLHNCDLTSEEAVKALFKQVDSLGNLEAAIYNAGSFRHARIVDIEPEVFEQCWRVGCYGGFLFARAAGQRLLAQGKGTILFTGATASLRGGAGFANLASPKFGLRALAQSLARELAPEGIHVAHVIIDGQIRSDRYEQLLEERGPDSLLEPDAIASQYLGLHRQPPSTWTFELDLRPWTEPF